MNQEYGKGNKGGTMENVDMTALLHGIQQLPKLIESMQKVQQNNMGSNASHSSHSTPVPLQEINTDGVTQSPMTRLNSSDENLNCSIALTENGETYNGSGSTSSKNNNNNKNNNKNNRSNNQLTSLSKNSNCNHRDSNPNINSGALTHSNTSSKNTSPHTLGSSIYSSYNMMNDANSIANLSEMTMSTGYDQDYASTLFDSRNSMRHGGGGGGTAPSGNYNNSNGGRQSSLNHNNNWNCLENVLNQLLPKLIDECVDKRFEKMETFMTSKMDEMKDDLLTSVLKNNNNNNSHNNSEETQLESLLLQVINMDQWSEVSTISANVKTISDNFVTRKEFVSWQEKQLKKMKKQFADLIGCGITFTGGGGYLNDDNDHNNNNNNNRNEFDFNPEKEGSSMSPHRPTKAPSANNNNNNNNKNKQDSGSSGDSSSPFHFAKNNNNNNNNNNKHDGYNNGNNLNNTIGTNSSVSPVRGQLDFNGGNTSSNNDSSKSNKSINKVSASESLQVLSDDEEEDDESTIDENEDHRSILSTSPPPSVSDTAQCDDDVSSDGSEIEQEAKYVRKRRGNNNANNNNNSNDNEVENDINKFRREKGRLAALAALTQEDNEENENGTNSNSNNNNNNNIKRERNINTRSRRGKSGMKFTSNNNNNKEMENKEMESYNKYINDASCFDEDYDDNEMIQGYSDNNDNNINSVVNDENDNVNVNINMNEYSWSVILRRLKNIEIQLKANNNEIESFRNDFYESQLTRKKEKNTYKDIISIKERIDEIDSKMDDLTGFIKNDSDELNEKIQKFTDDLSEILQENMDNSDENRSQIVNSIDQFGLNNNIIEEVGSCIDNKLDNFINEVQRLFESFEENVQCCQELKDKEILNILKNVLPKKLLTKFKENEDILLDQIKSFLMLQNAKFEINNNEYFTKLFKKFENEMKSMSMSIDKKMEIDELAISRLDIFHQFVLTMDKKMKNLHIVIGNLDDNIVKLTSNINYKNSDYNNNYNDLKHCVTILSDLTPILKHENNKQLTLLNKLQSLIDVSGNNNNDGNMDNNDSENDDIIDELDSMIMDSDSNAGELHEKLKGGKQTTLTLSCILNEISKMIDLKFGDIYGKLAESNNSQLGLENQLIELNKVSSYHCKEMLQVVEKLSNLIESTNNNNNEKKDDLLTFNDNEQKTACMTSDNNDGNKQILARMDCGIQSFGNDVGSSSSSLSLTVTTPLSFMSDNDENNDGNNALQLSNNSSMVNININRLDKIENIMTDILGNLEQLTNMFINDFDEKNNNLLIDTDTMNNNNNNNNNNGFATKKDLVKLQYDLISNLMDIVNGNDLMIGNVLMHNQIRELIDQIIGNNTNNYDKHMQSQLSEKQLNDNDNHSCDLKNNQNGKNGKYGIKSFKMIGFKSILGLIVAIIAIGCAIGCGLQFEDCKQLFNKV